MKSNSVEFGVVYFIFFWKLEVGIGGRGAVRVSV